MKQFNYRPVLTELTDIIKHRSLDPFDAYAHLLEDEDSLGLTRGDYGSTSITSGGHKRDPASESMRSIIEKNTLSAYELSQSLAHDGVIDEHSFVEPVALGNTGWSQSQYMEFWLHVIGGAEMKKGFAASSIEDLRKKSVEIAKRHEVDFEVFNNGENSHERRSEYFKLSLAYAAMYTSGNIEAPRGAKRLIRMIDPDTSLGAQAERAFARKMSIPVMNIAVMEVQSFTPSLLAMRNRRLAQDAARLIELGATIFDTRTGEIRLGLIEDEDAA